MRAYRAKRLAELKHTAAAASATAVEHVGPERFLDIVQASEREGSDVIVLLMETVREPPRIARTPLPPLSSAVGARL